MLSLRSLVHIANIRLRNSWAKATAGPPRKAKEPHAAIFRREDRFIVHSQSRTIFGLWIACDPFISLSLDASDKELGTAVLAALKQSSESVPHPQQSEPHTPITPLLKAAGVRSWRAFSNKTILVHAKQREQTILYNAWENRGPKNGFVPKQDCELTVAADSAEQIGAMLREALTLAN